MKTFARVLAVLALTLAACPSFAQQTTGTIAGRVIDPQDTSVPGATITATSTATGLIRVDVSDSQGLYRLNALPVGTYDVVTELSGFTRLERKDITVNVSETTNLDMTLRIAEVEETITVVGDTPLIPTMSSSIGEVVDLARIERLPLNGRQFANLAATVPGVGIGFHSDPTKSTQYTPQVSGGNGRNVNFIVDGGDNNDDTVGGLLQMFPLEAIQQFNVITHRFDAQYGRSDGGVINVVTKSGTNNVQGSWFTLFRDTALNARTTTETINHLAKQDYRRYQYGGSFGGPIVENRVHYFAAFERTQQDTMQAVNTLGLFPGEDGVFSTPYRENMFTGKLTANIRENHYLAGRYSRDTNSQPNGPALRAAPSTWSTSRNTFNSANVNDNWVIGRTKLNEFIFQFANFKNIIPGSSTRPYLVFPNGVTAGANPNAPQTTEQDKWQFRDDVSWAATGVAGLAHNFKAGVNWVHEPHLFISTTSGVTGFYTMASNDVNAPVQQVQVIGGASQVNIPLDFYSVYLQDDWRATNRLTFNLGVRWDYVTNMPLNQDNNPNFRVMQAAGAAGRFAGTALEDFGKSPRTDKNNIQPRVGFAYDLRGGGQDVVRGGWGIYTDFAYTNANALNAAIDAAGGLGIVFQAVNPAGLRKPDGSMFLASDPLSTIAAQNSVNTSVPPLGGQVQSPRLEQPYTRQTNIGWAHQLDRATALTADVVHVEGRDLSLRLRVNTLVNGRRNLGDLAIQPNSIAFRTALSSGESLYNALILGINRRMSRRLDLSASYTMSTSTSDIGSASDETDANLVQDVRDPFGPVQDAPSTRSDSRHRVALSAIVEGPAGISIAPIFLYRSALPTHSFEGLDLNADGNNVDKTASAYRYTGLNANGTATFAEAGSCDTVNCSRRAPFSQLNLRVSRAFHVSGSARVEAIAEVFNLFNAKNPFIPVNTRRLGPTGAPLSSFMQPTAFAGDFQQPEQRVGQVGFRITF